MQAALSNPDVAVPIHKSKRVIEIDLLRGLVMIIMALDHTRDFFHETAFTADPLDLQTTSPVLFFTRWITHFCAPVFVFLSGTSVYLQSMRKTRKELSVFLLKRGAWLIFADLIIMSLIITFDIHYSLLVLQVIWAIGISMVLLALVIYLPFKAILIIGILIVAGHNSLDFWEASNPRPYPIWYSLIHSQGFIPLDQNHTLAILYPFLPWTGLMLLGYCFGKLFQLPISTSQRNMVILSIGLFLLLLFVAVRYTNIYGDPSSWSKQNAFIYTLMSFVNTTKYPPSLMYICMTIGPALLLLVLLGRMNNAITKVIQVYGTVPFFYYLLHFFLIHLLCVILFLARGHTLKEGMSGVANFPFKFVIPGEGYSLGIVYLLWILVVAFLYPLCKWYQTYKSTHKHWWLSYI